MTFNMSRRVAAFSGVVMMPSVIMARANTSINSLLSGGNQSGDTGTSGTTNTGATNNGAAKKLYCN
jgi:hypothetical protein